MPEGGRGQPGKNAAATSNPHVAPVVMHGIRPGAWFPAAVAGTMITKI
jgi:hypothetical protein